MPRLVGLHFDWNAVFLLQNLLKKASNCRDKALLVLLLSYLSISFNRPFSAIKILPQFSYAITRPEYSRNNYSACA